jgi:hypothetical protein
MCFLQSSEPASVCVTHLLIQYQRDPHQPIWILTSRFKILAEITQNHNNDLK